MDKLISVVLPTYNRVGYLEYTLGLLKDQIKRNAEKVELIICNNASTDGTDSFLHKSHNEDPFFVYVNYDNHVEIGASIKRTINNATGKYVLMWGDDDIPCSMLLDILINCIEKNPDIACIHFNGLDGNDDANYAIKNLTVKHNHISNKYSIYEDSKEFAEIFWNSMGMMSSDLFLNTVWRKGLEEIDSSKHYGWDFLAPILCGLKGKKCMYVDFPLWVHRHPQYRSWQSRSAFFWLVGIPNLLMDLEKHGIINDFEKIWYGEVNAGMTLSHIEAQMALDKKFYYSVIDDILKYQKKNKLNRLYIYSVLWFLPSFLYKWLRNNHFKH